MTIWIHSEDFLPLVVAVLDPTQTPILTPRRAHDDGAGTPITLYAAYSYVGENDQETALSPVSTSVNTADPTNNDWIIRIPVGPPPGAVCVHLYLGTSPDDLRRQTDNQPLKRKEHLIHDFDPAGPVNVPGVPQSTVSSWQRAIDYRAKVIADEGTTHA